MNTKRRRWSPTLTSLCLLLPLLGSLAACNGQDPGAARATCSPHELAACPFCEPSLIERLDICPEHGIPEALCVTCRPELEAAFRTENDWCGGHDVPESQCGKCNDGIEYDATAEVRAAPPPAITPSEPTPEGRPSDAPPAETGRAQSSTPDVRVVVSPSDVPRARRPPAVSCDTERSLVIFANDDVAEQAGLRYAQVNSSPLRATLSVPARISYDPRRYARLAPRAPGIVREVRVELGSVVKAGQVLAVLESPQVGATRASLRQALARVQQWERNAGREAGLLEQGLTTEQKALHAEISLTESRITVDALRLELNLLGLDSELKAPQDGATSGRSLGSDANGSALPLLAPFDGEVIEMSAVLGESVPGDKILVAVADTARMCATLDVAPTDVDLMRAGTTVLLQAQGYPDQPVAGRVTWVAPQIDERTRTVEVRAEFDNPSGLLRAGGFGTARIITRDGEAALLVPKDAVQWEGCCNVAFVRLSTREFEPRKLLLGHDTGAAYEVLDGLADGETVVTQGSFLLMTELRKGSIGAGCCEIDSLGG
ncbi:MAG: hypothetical protein DRQ55_15135 [Planctomycetota bacterium]|nr:MAG: hypothetical protein DRQ55_15135 [Planctomycetota bacterium]